MKHRILKMPLSFEDAENEVNKFLDDGWLVKEIQTVSANNDGCYAVVLLEKKIKL